MGISFGGNKQKTSEQTNQNTTQSYTPDAGFMALLNPVLAQAQGAISKGYQSATPEQIQANLNPYTQSVIDTTVGGINRQAAMAGDNIDAKAAAAGAFGGSGWGRWRSENDRATAEQVAATTAGLNQDAYSAAQQMAMADAQNRASFDLNSLGSYGNLLSLLGNWGTSTGNMNGTSTGKQSGFKWGVAGQL